MTSGVGGRPRTLPGRYQPVRCSDALRTIARDALNSFAGGGLSPAALRAARLRSSSARSYRSLTLLARHAVNLEIVLLLTL